MTKRVVGGGCEGYRIRSGEDDGWECYNASEEEGQKRFGGDPPEREGLVWRNVLVSVLSLIPYIMAVSEADARQAEVGYSVGGALLSMLTICHNFE